MNSQFTFSLIFLFKQNKVYELTNAYHTNMSAFIKIFRIIFKAVRIRRC